MERATALQLRAQHLVLGFETREFLVEAFVAHEADAAGTNSLFNGVQVFGSHFEFMLERLVLFPEILLDASDARLEATKDSLQVLNRGEDVFAKGGEVPPNDFERGQLAIDERVSLGPFWTTKG